VTHPTPLGAWLHFLVWPEITAADAGARNSEECVGRLLETRVGDFFDTNVARAVHDSCSHKKCVSAGDAFNC